MSDHNKAVKSKELSTDLCDQIISRHRYGQGYETFSKALNVPRNTVGSTTVKWEKFGNTRSLSRAGCPAKFINWAIRVMVREVTKNPMITRTEVQT